MRSIKQDYSAEGTNTSIDNEKGFVPMSAPTNFEPNMRADTETPPHITRTGGSVTRLHTPPRRYDDQHANLRRSYQSFLRKLNAGEVDADTYQSWPVRPYAASI